MENESGTHRFLTIEELDAIEPITLQLERTDDDDFDPPPGAKLYECNAEIFCPAIGLRRLYSIGHSSFARQQINSEIKQLMELNREKTDKECIILHFGCYNLI